MIFKANPSGDLEGIEYRVDVTMRAESLEYDIILKNAADKAFDVACGIEVNLSEAGKAAGYKVTKQTGYKDEGLKSGAVNLPVGKFKETTYYFMISK
jgi:hypothetical protein